jgi:hypothetical protein
MNNFFDFQKKISLYNESTPNFFCGFLDLCNNFFTARGVLNLLVQGRNIII